MSAVPRLTGNPAAVGDDAVQVHTTVMLLLPVVDLHHTSCECLLVQMETHASKHTAWCELQVLCAAWHKSKQQLVA